MIRLQRLDLLDLGKTPPRYARRDSRGGCRHMSMPRRLVTLPLAGAFLMVSSSLSGPSRLATKILIIHKEKKLMHSRTQKLGYALLLLVLGMGLAVSSAFAAAKGKTFTGTVSDAMCGAKHMMAGDAASCTRECVGKGSKYALVVGDKVYILDTSDKAALAALDKQAGAQVKVTGTEKDNTITVTSVVAAP